MAHGKADSLDNNLDCTAPNFARNSDWRPMLLNNCFYGPLSSINTDEACIGRDGESALLCVKPMANGKASSLDVIFDYGASIFTHKSY